MRSCGTAPPPLWGRSFEKGCISNSERGNLNSSNSSCPMPTGEDGHIGESAAGVCPTGTKRPSSCSRHTRAFGAGWSGNVGTTALTSKTFVSEGSSRNSTASTRRRRPLRYHFFTMGGAKSHDTEDGILEPGAPDFEQKLLMLQRKPRARYRIRSEEHTSELQSR